MKLKNLCVIPLFLCASLAHASQFASVVEAMAIKSDAGYTNIDWEDTQKIKGVKWQWPYHQSGAHNSTMKGKTKFGTSANPNIGATMVVVEGSRTMVNRISISVANSRDAADMKLLGPGKARQIPTSCDMNYASEVQKIYEFRKTGYKPLYVKYAESWGASGESGSVDFTLAYQIEDAIDNPSCKAL